MAKSTNDTTAADTVVTPQPAKTATTTLRSAGAVMQVVAQRRPDGTATTFVTTTDANKKTQRGMTKAHASMDAARAEMTALAAKAEKLGWTRRLAGRGFVAKPDAFSTLPAAPKKAAK